MNEPEHCIDRVALAEAVANARRMLTDYPHVHYAPTTCRDLVAGLLAVIDSSPCFAKSIDSKQEVFVLRQQDSCAPFAIYAWATSAKSNGCREEKVNEARTIAQRWHLNFPNPKWPD